MDTSTRYPQLLSNVRAEDKGGKGSGSGSVGVGGVQIIHAINDADISYKQSLMIMETLMGDTVDDDIALLEERAKEVGGYEVVVEGKVKVGLRILEFGGTLFYPFSTRILPFVNSFYALLCYVDGSNGCSDRC